MAESTERETRFRAAVRDASVPASTSAPGAENDNGGAQTKVEDQVKTGAEAEEPGLKTEGFEEVNDCGDAVMTDNQLGKGQEQSVEGKTVAESSLEPAIGDNTAGTAVVIDASLDDSSDAAQASAQEQTSTQIQPQAQDDALVANVNNSGITEADKTSAEAASEEDASSLSDARSSLDSEFEPEADAENRPEVDKENTVSAQNQEEEEAIDELLTEIAKTQSQGKNQSQSAGKLKETEPLPSAPSGREPASLKRSLEDNDSQEHTKDASTSASSSQPNAAKKQRTDPKILPKSKAHAAQSKVNEPKQARTANGNDGTLALLEDTTKCVSEGLINCSRTIEQVRKVLAELQASIDKTKSSLKEVAAGIR